MTSLPTRIFDKPLLGWLLFSCKTTDRASYRNGGPEGYGRNLLFFDWIPIRPWHVLLILYVLAMASTAVTVLLGCAIEDPKLGQEMLPLLFVPQLLFAGFFVAPLLMPSWLGWQIATG